MTQISSSVVGLALASVLALGCGGGTQTASPELACPARGLPNPNPSYIDTVEGLVLVPARAQLREASAEEAASYRELVRELQAACGESPPGSTCELGTLRAQLTSLPAPDHPDIFTAIDGSFDAALSSAHTDYAAPDRDCDGQAESVCDARGIASGLVRAACELDPQSEETGHGH